MDQEVNRLDLESNWQALSVRASPRLYESFSILRFFLNFLAAAIDRLSIGGVQ